MKDSNKPVDAETDREAASTHRYRWSYAQYSAAEQARLERLRRRGSRHFALLMAAVFLVSFLILGAVLLLSVDGWEGDAVAGGADAVEPAVSVAEAICPATVLIYAENLGTGGSSALGTPRSGSGFFLTDDGYILTNAHVVTGYDTITVTCYNGQMYDAWVIGCSEADDIAVLKVMGSGHPAASIGRSEEVQVGELAIAIGHPSVTEATWTVTEGIISGLDRTLRIVGEGRSYEQSLTMLQMDTPVNHGNSGGPLCNRRGEVIGVVTRKLSDAEGVGYAIPITGAMEVAVAIMEGRLEELDSPVSSVHPYVGLELREIRRGDTYRNQNGVVASAQVDGLLVIGKDPECRLEAEVGSIIISVDQQTVKTVKAYHEILEGKQNGEDLYLGIYAFPNTDMHIFPVGP